MLVGRPTTQRGQHKQGLFLYLSSNQILAEHMPPLMPPRRLYRPYLCRSASCRPGQLRANCLMVESVMALVSFTTAREWQWLANDAPDASVTWDRCAQA